MDIPPFMNTCPPRGTRLRLRITSTWGPERWPLSGAEVTVVGPSGFSEGAVTVMPPERLKIQPTWYLGYNCLYVPGPLSERWPTVGQRVPTHLPPWEEEQDYFDDVREALRHNRGTVTDTGYLLTGVPVVQLDLKNRLPQGMGRRIVLPAAYVLERLPLFTEVRRSRR